MDKSRNRLLKCQDIPIDFFTQIFWPIRQEFANARVAHWHHSIRCAEVVNVDVLTWLNLKHNCGTFLEEVFLKLYLNKYFSFYEFILALILD